MRVAILLHAEATVIDPIEGALRERGHDVVRISDSEELTHSEVIIVDAEVAERAVKHVATAAPGTEVIVVGPQHSTSLDPDVIAHIESPTDLEQLLGYVDEVADITAGERRRAPNELVAFETLFAGTSPPIANLMRRVRLVARNDAPVWIFGDDGSGRSIVARAIHDRSSRRNGPFLAFNTAAHSDDELCRLLFHGDEPAVRTPGSTVFLEQVAGAGTATQRELMQFLDSGGIGTRLIVGVQAADPNHKVFSSELYYRLKVLEVEIPRLADRSRDLGAIVTRMLERLVMEGQTPPPRVTAETLRALERYSFPGNLLELAHALTHAFVVAHGGAIEPQHLPPSMRQPVDTTHTEGELQSLDTVAKRFEREYLLRVLRSVGGNRGRAAEILGLSRKGLWGKLKAHGISDDQIEADDADDTEPAAILQGPWTPRRT